MKKTLMVLSLLVAFGLIAGCSSNSTDGEANPLSSHPEPQSMLMSNGGGESAICINPNRAYYDVVVLDTDYWELCMNLDRVRYHCNSYTGHMWYQMGAFVFEGTLTAVYNHSLDMLAVTALDSGWDRGHILYSMQFTTGTNDLYGSFVYYEYPRRTNGINAWLAQGTIGTHVYGQLPSYNEEKYADRKTSIKTAVENKED